MMAKQIQMTALPNIPLVKSGDDLVKIILDGMHAAQLTVESGDIFVLAQKIVSKAEGRMIALNTILPSRDALKYADIINKDPRLVEVILNESSEVMRYTSGNKETNQSGHFIVRHRLGYVAANAGIDKSNVLEGNEDEHVLLLPENPDKSSEEIRQQLKSHTSATVAVIINDSHGRAWRCGTVGVALGVAGLGAIQDLCGKTDLFGRKLRTSQVALADELSAAASLLMGQSDEGTPIIHIRGVQFISETGSVQTLIRPKQHDLFL